MEYAQNGSTIRDIEEYCKTLPEKHTWKDLSIPKPQYDHMRNMLYDLAAELAAGKSPKIAKQDVQRKHHRTIRPAFLNQIYFDEQNSGRMERNIVLEQALITSTCRGLSGVSVITVFLSPYPNGQQFSCKWNCSYCPNEPGQPRSYLFAEPGVLRANQNNFDCVRQMMARIKAYQVNGHPTDKFEVLILGGTLASYPKDYLDTFMRDIFYSANICSSQDPVRDPLSLADEKAINTDGQHRVIGITIETRPDCVTPEELRNFRRWGVTRVQLGVQHTDDAILRKVNRGCGHKHTLNALKLLKDACFKVDIHIMPNLPGSSVTADKAMIDCVLTDLQPDQVKVYPCTTTPFTKILDDYKQGTYVPYNDADLTDVVLYWKTRVHPWIRNNRIVRDIPNQYIVAGVKTSSQRLDFQAEMERRNLMCRCIRCREAGRHPNAKAEDAVLTTRTYAAQGAQELFISWESTDQQVLFGFLRLRLPALGLKDSAAPATTPSVFPELSGAALIRELHVYGRTVAVGTDAADSEGKTTVAQHLGIGRRLLAEAERRAAAAGHSMIAVISGVGVQGYYEKNGYALMPGDGEFMMKNIYTHTWGLVDYMSVLVIIAAILCMCTTI